MKIDVKEVIINRLTGKPMQELAPGQDVQKLQETGAKPEMRDMTVGGVIAGSLLHPNAAQVDGKIPKPESVRERYKLANKILDAVEDEGAIELTTKEAAMAQDAVCAVYTQAAISGKVCEVLDGE